MKVRKALTNFLRVIADEAEKNPDFERRIAEAIGLEEKPKPAAADHVAGSASQRPKQTSTTGS